MPIVNVTTNMADRELSAEFDGELCQTVADMLGKPIERVTLEIHTNVRMFKARSRAPMMVVSIKSFDVFDPERNKEYAPKILGFLEKSVGIPKDRLVVFFEIMEKTNVPALLV